MLCESGAVDGTICGFYVNVLHYQLTCYPNCDPADNYDDMAMTSLPGGTTIMGDSGGPWFTLDGSTCVWAEGITHGTVNNTTTGEPTGDLFTLISVLSSDMGVWVNT